MSADMTFKPGDRVRTRTDAPTLAREDQGRTGVVDQVYPGTPYPYGVVYDDTGEGLVFSADELEAATEPPTPLREALHRLGHEPATPLTPAELDAMNEPTPAPDAVDVELGRLLALAAGAGLITGPDLVTPRMEQIAYVPETGALVRVPATARRIAS
jgi:hypothetical protein